MIATLIALLLSAFPLPLQDLPHAFPREGAKQLIDNERVTVWEAIWAKGKPTAMHRHRYDMVGVELAESTVKVTTPDGVARNGAQHVGQVFFLQKGVTHMEEGVSDTPRHTILIDLKEVTVPPLVNKTGLPAAFPREGSLKLLENDRLTVWDYSWTAGKPTAMHYHDKDVVVVYLEDGALSSITQDGQSTTTAHSPGEARFNARDRSHSELLVKGTQRVIAVELK